MSVLKRNSVCYGGGVDISNTLELRRTQETVSEEVREDIPPVPEEIQENREELLDIRERELAERDRKSVV